MNKTDAINCIQDIIDVANSHGSACVYSRNGGVAQLENVLECLKNSEPVVHAHWESIGHLMGNSKIQIACCSHCNMLTLKFSDGEESDGEEIEPHTPRCSWCGALMDEEVPNE